MHQMVLFNVTPPSAITSAACGLASAVSWGVGDFCGGMATKLANGYQVVIGVQLTGVVGFLALALASREQPPPAVNLLLCGIAGLFGAIGLWALYHALATGRMGLAAPVSGVLSAAVPAAAGSLFEGLPRLLTLAGFALALVAVWLVSRTRHETIAFRELRLPIVAGLGFGAFITLISRASGAGVYWPLVAARAASLAVLTSTAMLTRQRVWPRRDALVPVVLAGIFDAGGNAFLVMAAHAGRLDVAAVLSSLYPAATVLLAWQILDERISRWQFIGLLATLCAIVAITAP
jgi:drug/metabolite transporter (DMT)-like permease